MAEAFIEKTEYNQYLSAQDYIDQFYGDKEGISTTKLLSSPILTSTSDYLFSDFTGLEYVYFPNLSFISHKAFAGCVNLKEVNFQNVSYIESYAFKDCTSLKYLDLPKCISMRANAFEGCNSLEELSLPNWSMFTSSYGTGNEYNSYYALFENLPNLSLLNIVNRSKPVRLINLPKLETLIASNLISLGTMSSLDYSYQNQLSAGYFENLPKLSSLTMDKLSILYSRAFISVSNLETLILPECIQIYSNVFTGEIPDNIMTVLPKVKSMHFAGNYPFKSLIFPAPSNGNDLGGFGYMPNYAPEYIEFTNVSVISNTHTIDSMFALYGDTSIINNDTVLSFPKLEYTYSNTYRWDTNTKYSNTHVIINAPRLKELCSSAFNNFRILKEINLGQVSILNNDVFMHTACFGRDYSGSMSINGLLLSNTYNIKEVKAGAFNETKLRDNTLYLPNCEKFDFRQHGSSGYYKYILAIYNEDADATWFSQRIDTIHLPKLSEIIIDANLHYDRYSSFTYIDLMLPQKEMRFEECKRIQYLDGSSRFFYNRQSLSEMESFETLYIPECSTMEYIHNDSMPYTNGISLYYPVHHLYAPKLTNISNIRFLNAYDITLPLNQLSNLFLDYWLGFISNIDYSESFGEHINIWYQNTLSSKKGNMFLYNISLPNYNGRFYFYLVENYPYFISNKVNIYFGDKCDLINMSFAHGRVPDSYQYSRIYWNITVSSTIINEKVQFSNWGYWTDRYMSYQSTSFYYPTCKNVSYNITCGLNGTQPVTVLPGSSCGTILYLDDLDDYKDHTGCIHNEYGDLYLPEAETYHLNIICSSIDVRPSTASASVYWSDQYFVLSLGCPGYGWPMDTHDFTVYAPKLQGPTISILGSINDYIRHLNIYYDIEGNASITLGISSIYNISRIWNDLSTGSSYIESIELVKCKYLSLSNLNGIPSAHYRRYVHTLYLPKCESLYIPNVQYIEGCGLYIPKIVSLNLPVCEYIGSRGIEGSSLKSISIPNIKSLGQSAFYGCTSLEVLTLPPTCSYIGYDGIPSSNTFKVLELQRQGVVELDSNQWHYSPLTIKVPMSLISAYKNHSIWGSKYSSYWNIVGY